jgi:hypothetical protein
VNNRHRATRGTRHPIGDSEVVLPEDGCALLGTSHGPDCVRNHVRHLLNRRDPLVSEVLRTDRGVVHLDPDIDYVMPINVVLLTFTGVCWNRPFPPERGSDSLLPRLLHAASLRQDLYQFDPSMPEAPRPVPRVSHPHGKAPARSSSPPRLADKCHPDESPGPNQTRVRCFPQPVHRVLHCAQGLLGGPFPISRKRQKPWTLCNARTTPSS